MNYNDVKTKKAMEVVQSFMMITKTLSKFTQKNSERFNLTLHQLGILNTINSCTKVTLKEITEKLMIPKSTASINVDELVKKELVNRSLSEKDRREIQLSLTNKGKEISQKSIETPLAYMAMMEALEKIPKEYIENMIKSHEEILKNLNNSKLID